jgi:hypothetical protein
MQQGILAFNKTLLLKLWRVLIFKSFKRFTLYGPQSSHTSIQQDKIRNIPQTDQTEQNSSIKQIYTSRRSRGHKER